MQICNVDTEHLRRRCRDFLARDVAANVLVLSDLYPPLLGRSDIMAALEQRHVVGVLSIYHAFSKPSIVLAGITPRIRSNLLLNALERIEDEFVSLCPACDIGVFLENASATRCWLEYQMTLRDREPVKTSRVARKVEIGELALLDKFYVEQRAEAWVPFQLKIGPYYCVNKNDKIVSAAGVHAIAPQIAQLGNIFTDREYRNRGYATACVSALVSDLMATDRMISLFVRTRNTPAIHLYEKLGFKPNRMIAFLTMRKSRSSCHHCSTSERP